MKRKKLPIIKDLLITSIAAEGQSIGKVDNYVIFVRGAVPGDIVDVQLTRKRKSYAESRIIEFKKYSESRVDAFCSHFNRCGGCKWQMLPYKKQLDYKYQQVIDQFERIGGFEFPKPTPIIKAENDKFYRNKLEFTFANRKWIEKNEPRYDKSGRELEGLGFHVEGMFDRIIDIEECYLQKEPSNNIRNKIREFTKVDGYDYYNNRIFKGFMRNLIIKNTSLGEVMVIVVFAENNPEKINALMEFINVEFPELKSLQYVVNTKKNDSISDRDVICYSGDDFITEKIHNLLFKIGAKTFFQTNIEQAIKLYEKTLEFANPQKNEIAYDLYTGTGTIANFVADNYKKVVGIDNIPESIEHAKLNSQLNSINNTSFFAGDMKDILTKEFIEKNGTPDTVIMDPPRAGIHQNVIDILRNIYPEKIVYISCNPATQARDISLLSDIYSIEKVQPIDMFPHTHHVENLVLLEKK